MTGPPAEESTEDFAQSVTPRDLNGPWLLYDNEKDPYQLKNLIDTAEYKETAEKLDKRLTELLEERGDKFLPGSEYISQFGYTVDETGTVPYTN